MIPNNRLPNQTARAIHLRAPSTSGGKDWIGIVTTDPFYGGKLWVINGKTKNILNGGGQGRAVKAPGTEQSLIATVRKKLDAGYIHLDEYEARCGWHSQPSSQPAKAAPLPQKKPSKPPATKVPPKMFEEVEEGEREPTMCW